MRTGRRSRARAAERRLERGRVAETPLKIGDVQCFGQRLYEPCAHLERLTAEAGKPGTPRALIHKGGLRADILSDGEIQVGDEITGC
jgi:hypothetical protein